MEKCAVLSKERKNIRNDISNTLISHKLTEFPKIMVAFGQRYAEEKSY